MKAINISQSQCILGEGPYWHDRKNSFFWVDIESGVLYQLDFVTKETITRKFDHRITFIAEGQEDQLILAMDRSLARYDLATEKLEMLTSIEDDLSQNRFNDGKCDAKGRIWAGTMSRDFTSGAGSFYRIGTDLSVEKKLDILTIANGLAWTEDNQTLYFIDSPTREIKAYDFDLEKGNIKSGRVAVTIPEELGTPDGMCIDQDGDLWVAHYGGAGVFRWDPKTGNLIDKIELPVPNITSCTFGGEHLNYLLITTASENMSEEDLNLFPQSGDTFLVKTNSHGFLPNHCGI